VEYLFFVTYFQKQILIQSEDRIKPDKEPLYGEPSFLREVQATSFECGIQIIEHRGNRGLQPVEPGFHLWGGRRGDVFLLEVRQGVLEVLLVLG
jgi:hypothetical protein